MEKKLTDILIAMLVAGGASGKGSGKGKEKVGQAPSKEQAPRQNPERALVLAPAPKRKADKAPMPSSEPKKRKHRETASAGIGAVPVQTTSQVSKPPKTLKVKPINARSPSNPPHSVSRAAVRAPASSRPLTPAVQPPPPATTTSKGKGPTWGQEQMYNAISETLNLGGRRAHDPIELMDDDDDNDDSGSSLLRSDDGEGSEYQDAEGEGEEEEEEEEVDEHGTTTRMFRPDDRADLLASVSQASSMSSGFRQRKTQGPSDSFNIPGKKVVESATSWLKIAEPYYTFGMENQFEIPVNLIIEPTATMCYRKMNLLHVESLMNQMVENPGITPAVAEVVAWRNGAALTFQEDQLKTFVKGIPLLQFCAVSGQHSAQAVNNLIQKSREIGQQHLIPIVEKLRYRKCRLLNGDTPQSVLVELSMRNNSMNKTVAKFKSPFLDSIEHARNQYRDCGRPARPDTSIKGVRRKQEDFQVAFFNRRF